ncbi:phosphoenolpyruvate carboxykinase, partial [bacterium]|nr:phosphoenolpyruvate carboxykinase [bacterium]MBU4361531.1 phosphoenolpyruvate carboxykinase [bacterium]MCG2761574.1 phosphoenolpyruvate carboxykinase [Candidatus Atribacteria bacterium]
ELNKDYTRVEYIQQFSLRIIKYLKKMERMSKIFENIKMPVSFAEELKEQIERLKKTRTKFEEDIISPFKFLEK